MVLYIIYYTAFSASVIQWNENYFCSLHKMTETGELFVVVYKECYEDCSSGAAMRGGAQRPDLQVSELKKTGARSAGAHARQKPTSS